MQQQAVGEAEAATKRSAKDAAGDEAAAELKESAEESAEGAEGESKEAEGESKEA